MKTIRRLYFYAVAFISFEVVLWGLIGLLRSIFGTHITNSAEALARALSLILVGVPIFLIHWLWAQRASAREGEEKSASLRAVFLYGTLIGTLVPVVQNLLALINRAFLGVGRISVERAIFGGTQSWSDNLIAIVMNLVIAAYFWNVLRGEWNTLPDQDNYKDIRRFYRYLWVLYSLLMVIFGSQQILRFVFYIPTSVLGVIGRETFVNGLALLAVGTPIWVYIWRICQDALSDPAEKESNLRLVVLYLLALSGVITVLTAGGNLLDILLKRALGEAATWPDFVKNVGGPISIGIPLAAIWAYYGNWLNQHIQSDDQAPRRAGKKRVYFYILSLIGFWTSFVGVALLVSLVVDVVTGTNFVGSDVIRARLAAAIATIVVGLPLWLMTWRPMQAVALAEGDAGDHARRSVVRKAYLYLMLFAAVIGGMTAAGMLVFMLINAALGGNTGSHFLADVLNSLQLLLLFVVTLVYHLSTLRRDGVSRADALEAKQEQFNVLIFDHDGRFGEEMRSAFAKHAPRIPVKVLKADEMVASDTKVNAVVIPGSLAVNAPEPLENWLRGFNGSRLIVQDEAAGVYWSNDVMQAAQLARGLAEGQEIRPRSVKRASGWMIVVYVFAILFALQLLFMLFAMGISSLVD